MFVQDFFILKKKKEKSRHLLLSPNHTYENTEQKNEHKWENNSEISYSPVPLSAFSIVSS